MTFLSGITDWSVLFETRDRPVNTGSKNLNITTAKGREIPNPAMTQSSSNMSSKHVIEEL